MKLDRLAVSSMSVALACLLVLSSPSLSGTALPEGDDPPVRPGAPMMLGGTLGFFFRDPANGALYASTVGHGVDYVGQEIFLYEPWNLFVGRVVAMEFEGSSSPDWALVLIDEAARASPEIRYWGGPSRMPVPGDIDPGDVVCHFGWGMPFQFAEETRHRCGTLAHFSTDDELDRFWFRGAVYSGDSGGPVIHYPTGQPLGLVSVMRIPPGVAGGLDVCTLLERFSLHGFDLELATAEYDPPPPDPTIPVPSEYDPHVLLYGNKTGCFSLVD